MTIPRPSMDLAWVDLMEEAEQRKFYEDVAAKASAAANGGGYAVLEACLHEWRLTADALDTASMRVALLEEP